MDELYNHIFLKSTNKSTERYTNPAKSRGKLKIPDRNREAHSNLLLQKFDSIWKDKDLQSRIRNAKQIPTREGTYLSFSSALDHDLVTKSLENIRGNNSNNWIRLLNIKTLKVDEDHIKSIATVYIPRGKEGYFVEKIKNYQTKISPRSERPQNNSLVNSIEDVSLALMEGLWTDKKDLIPNQISRWCEAWIRVDTKGGLEKSQIHTFKNTLNEIGIIYKSDAIIFPERAILLINANEAQLIELMLRSDLLAEFRAGQEPASFWVKETASEQQEWVNDLIDRITIEKSNVKVCILDTGVNNGHQLLEPVLSDMDSMAVKSAWGTNDHYPETGHGTLMAGIAEYGSLEKVLATNDKIHLTHSLCSVKVLPPPTQEDTPKELWGSMIAQGISRAEIQNPEAKIIYCMAVTSIQDIDRGRPSSWSGEIDNLAFGEDNEKRLIIVSAGNMKNYHNENDLINYPSINYTTSIQNPAQSWNALTVGAYTEKVMVRNPMYSVYPVLAKEGELSPHSTTSMIWERKWPRKPDVVFEGGNLLNLSDSVSSHEDLELLSTSRTFNRKPLDVINATSAATAKASWFASKIAYMYQDAWMETIRGLIVHSSEWNEAMKAQLSVREKNRGDYNNLLRTFGYGTPDLDKALYSKENSLTFIAEETIQPFILEDGRGKTKDIHIYNLPWPQDLLIDLETTPVKLRITLSYFIQPGAGEIGWKDKYRYQSYGLRFDLNNTGEDENTFRKRINAAAREEEEEDGDLLFTSSANDRWAIGKDNRSNGSIHSDYWEGTAAELATCNFIAVYPIIGWWRERTHLGKVDTITRYSLIISLETPIQDIELYTTVKNMIEIPIEVQTS
ncbi:hypothetical protein CMU80_16135 [Elizabethkingia anophelis]|nr:hypothetical protein [Elizabethkingia anophelis]